VKVKVIDSNEKPLEGKLVFAVVSGDEKNDNYPYFYRPK